MIHHFCIPFEQAGGIQTLLEVTDSQIHFFSSEELTILLDEERITSDPITYPIQISYDPCRLRQDTEEYVIQTQRALEKFLGVVEGIIYPALEREISLGREYALALERTTHESPVSATLARYAARVPVEVTTLVTEGQTFKHKCAELLSHGSTSIGYLVFAEAFAAGAQVLSEYNQSLSADSEEITPLLNRCYQTTLQLHHLYKHLSTLAEQAQQHTRNVIGAIYPDLVK